MLPNWNFVCFSFISVAFCELLIDHRHNAFSDTSFWTFLAVISAAPRTVLHDLLEKSFWGNICPICNFSIAVSIVLPLLSNYSQIAFYKPYLDQKQSSDITQQSISYVNMYILTRHSSPSRVGSTLSSYLFRVFQTPRQKVIILLRRKDKVVFPMLL